MLVAAITRILAKETLITRSLDTSHIHPACEPTGRWLHSYFSLFFGPGDVLQVRSPRVQGLSHRTILFFRHVPRSKQTQDLSWPWVKIQIVPPVSINQSNHLGSKMGGEFTNPNQNGIPKRCNDDHGQRFSRGSLPEGLQPMRMRQKCHGRKAEGVHILPTANQTCCVGFKSEGFFG